MKIDSISAVRFNGFQGIKNTQNKVHNSHEITTNNELSGVYPVNYYVSFKGNESVKSKAMLGLEKSVDDFYEENKGQPTQYLEIGWADFEFTPSRFINDLYMKKINGAIKANQAAPADEELVVRGVKAGLKALQGRLPMRLRDKNINYDEKALEMVKGLQEAGELPEKISYNQNSYSERIEIEKPLRMAVVNSLPEDMPQDFKLVLASKFIEQYANVLKGANPPAFTEELHKNLKDLLAEEPFKTFNDKMLKIEAKNNDIEYTFNVEKTAHALRKDLVEKRISPFDNEKLYEFLSANEERTDFLLEKLYGYGLPLYSSRFKDSGLDEKYKVLFVDPGVAANSEALVEFAKSGELTGEESPFELRQKFSDYLGKETVNYAFYSTTPENAVKQGIFARVLSKDENSLEAIKEYIEMPSQGYGNTHFARVQDNLKGDRNNEYLRVTSPFDRISVNSGSYIYGADTAVVQTDVPKLSLVKQEDGFSRLLDSRKMTNELESLMFVPFVLPIESHSIRVVKD